MLASARRSWRRWRWPLTALALILLGVVCCRPDRPAPPPEVARPESAPAVPLTPTPSGDGPATAPPTPAAVDVSTSIRLLGFRIDATGLTLASSALAPGRAKAPPRSHAPDRLEFEVHDPHAAVVYAGSLDHPLRGWRDVEDAARPGQWRRIAVTVPANEFLLRLPADVPAARILWFDVTPAERRPAGEFPLP